MTYTKVNCFCVSFILGFRLLSLKDSCLPNHIQYINFCKSRIYFQSAYSSQVSLELDKHTPVPVFLFHSLLLFKVLLCALTKSKTSYTKYSENTYGCAITVQVLLFNYMPLVCGANTPQNT